jgi:type I restriction enzyme S subunit
LPAGGQRQIARAQYGQTKPGLNFEQIRNFRVPVPPVKEQLEFARRVAASKALRAKSQASSICIDDLFSSLQHRAFRGEL